MKNKNEDGCMKDIRPWWKRKIARLWKWEHLNTDLPKWAKDGLVTDTETCFSFKDRIRILISGRTRTKIFIATENEPGKTETKAIVHPIAPTYFV